MIRFFNSFRRTVVFALILLMLSSPGAPAAGASVHPPPPRSELAARIFSRYAFDIDLDYAQHRLDAVEQIGVLNSSGATLDELVFNVPPAHADGVFLMRNVRASDEPAAFDLVGTTLTITLPGKLLPGDAVTLTLDFALRVPPLDGDAESFASADLSYTDDATMVGYWYPILAPYRPGRGWLTVPWHPVGDPFVSESADYTATITATPGVGIVAGGQMAREDNVWRFDLPRGRAFAFIASPRHWHTDVTVGGVTYSLYTFSRHTRLAPVAMQTVIRSALLYTSLYGPYPYSTLRVAEVGGRWSVEFSGLVALGEIEFENYDGTNRSRLVRITAHEVSHQWWYGVVGNDQAREPWLDEGLARFNELRYYEFYSPRDAAWWRNEIVYPWTPGGTIDAPIYEFSTHNGYIGRIYNRGALFLDTLRARMGPSAFNAFLRDLYRRGSFQIITSDDFFAVLNEHTRADMRPLTMRFFSGQ